MRPDPIPDVTVLEEPSTSEKESRGSTRLRSRRIFQACSLVILFSATALEEPLTAAEGIY